MTILQVYIDDRTQAILEAHAARLGRTVESLAEAAVAEAAIQANRNDPVPQRELKLTGGKLNA
jgi:hypothetical protein